MPVPLADRSSDSLTSSQNPVLVETGLIVFVEPNAVRNRIRYEVKFDQLSE